MSTEPPSARDRVAPSAPNVDRFVDPIRTVLSTAAIVGDEFEVAVLATATGLDTGPLRGHLAELEREGILDRIDDENYRFADLTTRQAIYDELETSRRLRLHRQIGEAIENLYGTESSDHLELLALHFTKGVTAETKDKAIEYAIKAGRRAHRLKAYQRAGAYWRSALKMMSAGGRPDLRASALLRLSDELVSSGPEAVSYLEEVIRPLESLQSKSWIGYAHMRLGYFFSAPHTGAALNVPRAMAHFDTAEPLLQSNEDRRKLAELFQQKCGACNLSMQTELGLESARRAMDLCEQIGDDFRWIQAAAVSTRPLVAMGRLSEAFTVAQKAYEKAEALDDPFSGSVAAWMGGLIPSDLLDYGGALNRYLAELDRPRTSRSAPQTRMLQTEAAHMYRLIGELEQSRHLLQQIRGPGASTDLPFEDGDWERNISDVLEKMNLARTNGNLDWISLRSHWLGGAYRVAGKREQAEQAQLESLRINRAAPNFTRVLWAAPDLCLLYFDMGRREDARRLLAECHAILARGEDWRGTEGMVMRAQAVVSALDRRFIDADSEFEKAIDIHRRYHNRWNEAEAFVYWGRALITASDKRRAGEKLVRSIEIYRRIGAGQAWIDRVNQTRAKAGVTIAGPIQLGASSASPCSFAREGAIWTISHRNRTFRIKDMKGLRYIAHLLAHPGEEFHVLDLLNAIDGPANAGTRQINEDLRITNDLGDAGELLDQRSKTEYRHRRDELRADLDDAEADNDRGRMQRIRAELEMIEEQLASAIGLGGRDRKAADHLERARDRIRKSIHKSLASIRENDASLGHHLTTCIRTGYLCSYSPDPATR